jgi:hypothetical protein
MRKRDKYFQRAIIFHKRRESLPKLTIRIISLFVLFLLAGVRQASAQGVSAYFGVGSAFDSAATSAATSTTPACPSQQIYDGFTGVCETAPTMGGVFGVFGADFMIKPHLGINAEYSFRFAQANYLPDAGLNVRPAFYDFNAVYQPTSGDKRIVPVFEGGIGGAKLSFYATESCTPPLTCSQSEFYVSNNHFQVHGAAGVKVYVKSDIFIKPQFDIHWVDNLNQQYGRTTVPEVTVSIGYTFGRQ